MKSGQAPKEIDHVYGGKKYGVEDSKDHIHFKNQRPTLNSDGTWGHLSKGETPPKVSNGVKKWLEKNGWTVPK